MPRKPVILSDQCPYHLTARVNNRDAFPIEMSEVWEIFSRDLYALSFLYNFRLHSAVLMPNHFHLIVSTPDKNLSAGMKFFMQQLTRDITFAARRSNRVFGKRYHWSIIQDRFYFWNAFKYVYQNPLRANLCTRVEDYPFSTLNGLVGGNHLLIPIVPELGRDSLFVGDLNEGKVLEWLNTRFEETAEERLKSGFHKRVFTPRVLEWRKATDLLRQQLM